MKVEARMEQGRPLLVLADEIQRDKTVTIYSPRDGHCSASRAYIRSLPKPATARDRAACWATIRAYSALAAVSECD